MSKLRHLGMPPKSTENWVSQMQHSQHLSLEIDAYNSGEAVSLLESRTADILGKPAALFFPKGMAAQFAMLKAVEEQSANSNVILHPLSHLAWDERDAYRHLLQLNAIFAGANDSPMTRQDLDQLSSKAGCLIVELPLRRAGFRATPWADLVSISKWCKDNDVHLHMDGARLWESACYYQKPEAEIAQLFDSVYVSYYKGLGGLGGAILAGEQVLIDSCRVWRSRLAADQFSAFPQLITALDGLQNNHKLIPGLITRARSIAAVLQPLQGIEVLEPHTNGFFVFLNGSLDELNERAERLTCKTGLKLFNEVVYYPNTQRTMVELQVGNRHSEITDQEIIDYFSELVSAA